MQDSPAGSSFLSVNPACTGGSVIKSPQLLAESLNLPEVWSNRVSVFLNGIVGDCSELCGVSGSVLSSVQLLSAQE